VERGSECFGEKVCQTIELTARATPPEVSRFESSRADMVTPCCAPACTRGTGRGYARVPSSAIPFLALGFRPSSRLGGALFGGLCPVVASQTSFMHPRWDVGAFDFEDRTRATLPADSRAMRFLKTDVRLVRGCHFPLIHDQAVDAITPAGRELQRRDPEDRARGRGV
jgi:hypothetical protein